MSPTVPQNVEAAIREAIALIRATPGYADQADTLSHLLEAGKIRYVGTLEDRAHAGLLGTITLGPEPFAAGATVLGLAETLVHELFHLGQNPLEKTASYWTGVFTRTDSMVRYERPAYTAALEFLQTYKNRNPADAPSVDEEIVAVQSTFLSAYGDVLA